MRSKFFSYFLWVLVPVATAFGLSQTLIQRTYQLRKLESGERFGRLTAVFFLEQMSARATELSLAAPILSDPDRSSSVIQAALRGDTVAALGTLSGELTLSVALVEQEADSPEVQIRAMTQPFPPHFLTRLHGSVGYPGALYLRGQRVTEEPPGFGPEALPDGGSNLTAGSPDTLPTASGVGVLVPLGDALPAAAPLQLLIAPSLPALYTPPFWRGPGALLLGAGLGIFVLLLLLREREPNGPSRINLLSLVAYVTPMGTLWLGLLGQGEKVDLNRGDFSRGEMVRVMAMLREGGEKLGHEAIAQATGFGVTRIVNEEVESTLDEGPPLIEVRGLPLPPSSLPTTGVVSDELASFAFATVREGPEQRLILTRPSNEEPLRRVRLLLAGLGGAASLLGMMFLFRGRSRP